MVKFARLADAMSEFFELEASPVEGESIQQKNVISKGEKGKAQKKVIIVHAQAKNVLTGKRGVSGKRGMLSCCECLCE